MKELKLSARKMGISLSADQLAQFDVYRREILLWNAKINLISEKSAQDIVNRHFLDSLTALHFITKTNARLIDVGCGAGFPGIPLKIALPSLTLYLVEINRKKTTFLKQIIHLLNLKNAHVLAFRTETLLLQENWKALFDVLISRAAFKLPEMLPLGAFFLGEEGTLIALKGNKFDQELLQANSITPLYKFTELFSYDTVPITFGTSRKIIIGKKTK